MKRLVDLIPVSLNPHSLNSLLLKLGLVLLEWLYFLTSRNTRLVDIEANAIHRIMFVSKLNGYFDLGDIIMSNSIICLVKKNYPRAQLILIARKDEIEQYQEVFYKKHSWVDTFQTCPDLDESSLVEWTKFYFSLCYLRADMSITNIVSLPSWLLYMAGISIRVGLTSGVKKKDLFITHPVKLSHIEQGRIHWTDLTKGYAKALGVNDFSISEIIPYVRFINEPIALKDTTKLVVIIHIGGSCRWNRRWSRENFLKICILLLVHYKVAIYLVGGEEEEKENEWLRETILTIHSDTAVVNFSGVSINTMLNLYQRAALYLGNDSGLMHLAVSVGLPVIALFGPSDHRYIGPDKVSSIHRTVTKCFPCSITQNHCLNRCSLSFNVQSPEYTLCMKEIDVDRVWIVVVERLSLFACNAYS